MQRQRRDVLRFGAAAIGAGIAGAAPMRDATAQAAEEIRIGALTPVTGVGAVFGPGMAKGIELAAADINAGGGLLEGRRLRVYYEDSRSDPQAGVNAARKLIDVNRVAALLGTWSSGVTMAVAPIVMENRVVNMNVSGTTDLRDMRKDDWIWPVAGSNIAYGQMMANYCISQGFKRAAFMAFNNPSGITLGEEFRKVFDGQGRSTGATVVYNGGQPSYRAELTRALSTRPEVIALGSYLPDTTILMREAFALGEDVKWVGPFWAINPALATAVGNARAVEGAVSIGAVNNRENPAFPAYRERFEAQMRQEVMANPFGAMAYDMMIVSALAIQSAGSADPAVWRSHIRRVSSAPGRKVGTIAEGLQALRAREEIDYDGISGTMDFDEVGEAQPYFGWWQLRNGQLAFQGSLQG